MFWPRVLDTAHVRLAGYIAVSLLLEIAMVSLDSLKTGVHWQYGSIEPQSTDHQQMLKHEKPRRVNSL